MVQHLNTTTCCGHTFTAQDIVPPLMNERRAFGTQERLYGGHAKWFAKATCPECRREYLLWLKPVSGSYRVLTISQTGEPEPVQGDLLFDPDTATREELRNWLKERDIKYFGGATDEQLREMVRGALVPA